MNAIFVALRSASATNPVRLGDKGNGTPESKAEAKRRHAHLNDGHIPDIYRTGPPHILYEWKCYTPFKGKGALGNGSTRGGGAASTTDGHSFVFGSTLEYLRGKVLGQKQMSAPSEPPLNRRTGVGRVDPRLGDSPPAPPAPPAAVAPVPAPGGGATPAAAPVGTTTTAPPGVTVVPPNGAVAAVAPAPVSGDPASAAATAAAAAAPAPAPAPAPTPAPAAAAAAAAAVNGAGSTDGAATGGDVKMEEAPAAPASTAPAPEPVAPPPPLVGLMSRVQATLKVEHPQLLGQLELMHSLMAEQLLPSATERLLADVSDLLHLGLSQPTGPPDRVPTVVLDALGAIDAHYMASRQGRPPPPAGPSWARRRRCTAPSRRRGWVPRSRRRSRRCSLRSTRGAPRSSCSSPRCRACCTCRTRAGSCSACCSRSSRSRARSRPTTSCPTRSSTCSSSLVGLLL
jgi:hypothetical protein